LTCSPISTHFLSAVLALHGHTRGEQTDTEAALELAPIAVPVVDVHHGAQATSVIGRVSSLVDPDIFDGIGIERGEEAEEVGWIVDRGAIEQDKGLVRTAAANVEAARVVGCCLDARKQLQ